MANKKLTKGSLFASMISLLMCFAMLLGTTFAWFTDNASTARNTIKSGNLDIEVEYTLDGENWDDLDGASDLFQKGLWEPGHTEVAALKITNKGSLALKYAANMNIASETVGKTKDGSDIVLSDILTVSTLVQQAVDADGNANVVGDITVGLAFSGENSVAYENVSTFKSGNVLRNDVELMPGAAHYMIIKVDMPETVGNEANHNGTDIPEIDFGINVLATQFTYENDSFGNQYDANAEYPMTAGDLSDALENGESVVLTNDIVYNNTDPDAQLIIENDTAITVKGNGYTITNVTADPSVGNHGYVGFVAPAVTVSDLTVTGTGFVELGDYYAQGGTYVANNLVLKNMVSTLANGDKGYTLACTFCHYGTAELNNCTMTGAEALSNDAIPVDAGFVNGTTTTINGGEYGVAYCWSKSQVEINGAKIGELYTAPTNAGYVHINKGTTVDTLTVNYSNLSHATKANLEKLVIAEGATVGEIVFNGNTYTTETWAEYVASLG